MEWNTDDFPEFFRAGFHVLQMELKNSLQSMRSFFYLANNKWKSNRTAKNI